MYPDATEFEDQCRKNIEVNYHSTLKLIQEMEPLFRASFDPRVITSSTRYNFFNMLETQEQKDFFNDKDGTLTLEKISAKLEEF